jgi:hypothetical protein
MSKKGSPMKRNSIDVWAGVGLGVALGGAAIGAAIALALVSPSTAAAATPPPAAPAVARDVKLSDDDVRFIDWLAVHATDGCSVSDAGIDRCNAGAPARALIIKLRAQLAAPPAPAKPGPGK